jgi:hypothetical protein
VAAIIRQFLVPPSAHHTDNAPRHTGGAMAVRSTSAIRHTCVSLSRTVKPGTSMCERASDVRYAVLADVLGGIAAGGMEDNVASTPGARN